MRGAPSASRVQNVHEPRLVKESDDAGEPVTGKAIGDEVAVTGRRAEITSLSRRY